MQLWNFINSEKFETHINLGLKHSNLKHSGFETLQSKTFWAFNILRSREIGKWQN